MNATNWNTQEYLYVTAECVTGLLTFLGNSLVLVAIVKTRSLRTVTNCFIGSLAAADVLVGLIIPPTVISPYFGLPTNFYGCVLVNSLVVLITNISTFNLLSVALERFLAVSKPFFYQRVMTRKRALLVVVATWVIAVLVGLIPVMGWNLGSEGFQFCAFVFVIDLRYMVYLIFFGITLPVFLAMLVIYLYIFYVVQKQRKHMESQQQIVTREMQKNARRQRKEIRGAKGLAYVIILFAVCWLPIHIMNTVTVLAPEKSADFRLLLVAIVLSHANSVFNPFLYAFSNSKFKYAMKRILCCGRLKKPPDYYDTQTDFTTRQRVSHYSHPTSRSIDTSSQTFTSAISSQNEELPQPDESSLKTSQGTRTSIPSLQLRPGELVSNASRPEVQISNGNGTLVSDESCQLQANVGRKNHREDNGVQINNYSMCSESVKRSGSANGQNVWTTSSSHCVQLDQEGQYSSNEMLVISASEEHLVRDTYTNAGYTEEDSPASGQNSGSKVIVKETVELSSAQTFNGAGRSDSLTAADVEVGSSDRLDFSAGDGEDLGTFICVRL